MDRVLRLPDVLQLIGMGRTWLYAAVKSGVFPKPIRIGKRAVGWRASDIEAWLAEREKLSRG
ncbi:MAG: hypothetical protein KatS3mg123_0284 [Burkholderiales bacterium]|nr:MAG: hypothetical protein KatS3mg123_0284 [Burkholderiales bacterium]